VPRCQALVETRPGQLAESATSDMPECDGTRRPRRCTGPRLWPVFL